MALQPLCYMCICIGSIWLISLIALYCLISSLYIIAYIAYRLRQVSTGKQPALRSSMALWYIWSLAVRLVSWLPLMCLLAILLLQSLLAVQLFMTICSLVLYQSSVYISAGELPASALGAYLSIISSREASGDSFQLPESSWEASWGLLWGSFRGSCLGSFLGALLALILPLALNPTLYAPAGLLFQMALSTLGSLHEMFVTFMKIIA